MTPVKRWFAMFAMLIAGTPLIGRESAPADAAPVRPAEAIRRIGQSEIVVEMVVKAAKDRLSKRGVIYLDSEADFQHSDNLGVAISAGAATKLRQDGISDPAAHFLGKTIRVRGCVMRFEERPYLPVLDPKQIDIVAGK